MQWKRTDSTAKGLNVVGGVVEDWVEREDEAGRERKRLTSRSIPITHFVCRREPD